MNPFLGTYTALITPFKDDAIDFAALERLVEHQIVAGVDGLVPCGTTGESPTLTPDEHDEVVHRVVKAARGRAKVLAGAGSNSTAQTLRMSQHAADAGADGLLLVAPYYNRPTQEGLFRHYAAVAKAVKLPIMLYNIPGRTGVEIAVDTIRRLHEEHPSIAAVKHATGSVDGASELMSCSPIAVLSGDDPLTLPLMSVGAVGVVSVLSNLAPRSVERLTQVALAGDFKAARAAHQAIYGMGKALLSLATNPIPIKTAMALRGFCREEFRLPLCAMTAESRVKLERLMAENVAD